MKTITIIRHAKAVPRSETMSDIQRPLANRGVNNAPDMAQRFKPHAIKFGWMYTSPSARTLETAELIAAKLEFSKRKIVVEPELYTFNFEDLIAWLRTLDNSLKSIAVVGHNPAVTELFNFLALTHLDKLPTCAIATLTLKIKKWADLSSGSGRIQYVDYPKNPHGNLAGTDVVADW